MIRVTPGAQAELAEILAAPHSEGRVARILIDDYT